MSSLTPRRSTAYSVGRRIGGLIHLSHVARLPAVAESGLPIMDAPLLALFNLPGGTEWIVILLLGLIFFGRRLPDVARSIGKSIVEFKRGIRDVQDDIHQADRLDRSNTAPGGPAKLENQRTDSPRDHSS